MKNNEVLQREIQEALRWEPLLQAAEIGVSVDEGIVTLTGTVNSYDKKAEAEEAAKSVAGVQAVIENIHVSFNNGSDKTDSDLTKHILKALKLNSVLMQGDRIKLTVENGWVTLEGQLPWNYEKKIAKTIISGISGVKGLTNNIIIKSEENDKIEKKDIERALDRNVSVDNSEIKVSVVGNKVTLNGTVKTWYQKDEAARIAWNAPGVWEVDNELAVDYDD